MDDQDQWVGVPSLTTPNEGSEAKLKKKNSILKNSKAEFGLTKAFFYYFKSQSVYPIILFQNRSPRFLKGKLNHSVSIVSLKFLVVT